MVYKGIIFDMDGVLFETESFYYKRRADFLASKGISLDHIPAELFIGGRLSQIWELVLEDEYETWDIEALEAEYKAYKECHPAPYSDCLIEGVRESLATLQAAGLVLAVASNTDLSDVERALQESGLSSYFHCVSSAMDTGQPKPDPSVYLHTLEQIGLFPYEALVIEDSTKGIAAGKAAGLTVWGIKDPTRAVDQSQADALIASVAVLPQLLLPNE